MFLRSFWRDESGELPSPGSRGEPHSASPAFESRPKILARPSGVNEKHLGRQDRYVHVALPVSHKGRTATETSCYRAERSATLLDRWFRQRAWRSEALSVNVDCEAGAGLAIATEVEGSLKDVACDRHRVQGFHPRGSVRELEVAWRRTRRPLDGSARIRGVAGSGGSDCGVCFRRDRPCTPLGMQYAFPWSNG